MWELMETNAKGSLIRNKCLILTGACVANEHPDVLNEFSDCTLLKFCPEKEHINMAFYKLMAMMSVAESLTVITVDGSPHCVQLHYIAEEVRRYSEKKFPVRHFVLHDGRKVEISAETVKVSRYLRKIESLIQ